MAVVLLLAVGHVAATQDKSLSASDAWVKLPARGDTQAMAFANIENPGMYAVYIKSASSEVAGKVELRDASRSGDAARQPLEFATVPASDWLYMGPNGVHLALVDLKRPLSPGDKVMLILRTDIGDALEVQAVVKE